MKKIVVTITCFTFILTLAAFRFATDIFQKLGIEQSAAHYSIERNILFDNVFSLPKAKLLTVAIQGDKKGLARELGIYIRQYCESDEFATAYSKEREARKPTSEPAKLMDAETIKQMEGLAKMYEEWANNKSYDAKTREEFKTQATDIRKQLETEKDPTPNKTNWEKAYPVSPTSIIRRKLEEAISIMESVDFNATTTSNKYGQQIFDNPEYEKKSKKWKACYRAGKDVNMLVKDFINQWLKEGIKTGQPGPAIQQTKPIDESNGIKKSEPTSVETPAQETDKKKKPTLKSIKNKVLGKNDNS